MNEAIKVYKKALSIEPNYVSFNNMGNALKAQGKLDEAIDAYKNSIYLSLIMLLLIITWQLLSKTR